jgi:hypothetical protein
MLRPDQTSPSFLKFNLEINFFAFDCSSFDVTLHKYQALVVVTSRKHEPWAAGMSAVKPHLHL